MVIDDLRPVYLLHRKVEGLRAVLDDLSLKIAFNAAGSGGDQVHATKLARSQDLCSCISSALVSFGVFVTPIALRG
jgi:hypothetical protein